MNKNCLHVEPSLFDAYTHATSTRGGGFRERLTLTVGDACGTPRKQTHAIACALERFHLASLIIDDLPCMDDARMRRGRLCTHRVHGEANAILVALALVNEGYKFVWDALSEIPHAQANAMSEEINHAMGLMGILNGQAWDIAGQHETDMDNVEWVEKVAIAKTGKLFGLCLKLPAMASGCSSLECESLEQLATYWALIYQGKDDLCDVLASSKEIGKDTGQDIAKGRPNLAVELGYEQALARLHAHQRKAIALVAKLKHVHPRWDVLTSFQEKMAQGIECLVCEFEAA